MTASPDCIDRSTSLTLAMPLRSPVGCEVVSMLSELTLTLTLTLTLALALALALALVLALALALTITLTLTLALTSKAAARLLRDNHGPRRAGDGRAPLSPIL